ncbi:hypothetical protein [Corynebacterium sp. HFH0082]|uniref:hypothetical protein n=1 Tax=Corynebacterium sp. HFH0082 TaxID=1078764 RepID=UPI00034E712A|nr:MULTISPECIES: hypothetical protein [Corynebacterium]EPD47506.1 hypothetical protein HMPREF1206_01682 [Corynebacterium sp. HFH0082]MDK8506053.1 hypothetical protein [Corynebacterium amycolatum]
MSDYIVGKIAKVLGNYDVVLDKGALDGINAGDYVAVLGAARESIIDLSSTQTRGVVNGFKASLRITQLTDFLAVASTYRLRRVNRGGYNVSSNMKKVFEQPRWENERESMQVEDSDDEFLDEGESTIREGDIFLIVSKDIADQGFVITDSSLGL